LDVTSVALGSIAIVHGAPASSPEGTLISLTSTVTIQVPPDTFTYAWSVTKNGNPIALQPRRRISASRRMTMETYVVTLTVTDDDLGSGSDARASTSPNVAPSAAIIGAPASSAEGTLISLTSSVTDPGSADTSPTHGPVTKNGNPYASGSASSSASRPMTTARML